MTMRTSLVPEGSICACGCREEISPSRAHLYQASRFKRGHNMRLMHEPHHSYVPKPEEIPSGLCECGCGKATEIAPYTDRARRWFMGHPKPLDQHHTAVKKGRQPQLKAFELTDTEAAYFAGIVDGEGSISIRGDRFVRLTIGNTSEPLIAWLSRFGGTLATTKPIPNRKQCYRWQIGNRADVHLVLSRIEPFMLVKRDQAQRALAITSKSIHND